MARVNNSEFDLLSPQAVLDLQRSLGRLESASETSSKLIAANSRQIGDLVKQVSLNAIAIATLSKSMSWMQKIVWGILAVVLAGALKSILGF